MGDDIDWMNDYEYVKDMIHHNMGKVKWLGSDSDFYDAKENDMSWYSRDDYDRAVKVAEATLNALEKGHTIEQLIKRNPSVRVFYTDMKTREEKAAKAAILDAARKQKAAEAKAAKEAAKAEIMSRLTPEELEAFGLNKVSKRK